MQNFIWRKKPLGISFYAGVGLKNVAKINIYHYSILTKNMKEYLIETSTLLFKKTNNSNVYYHNYMKVGINSDDDLSLEKKLNIQNTIVFIGPIYKNNYNYYHHDVLFMKFSWN